MAATGETPWPRSEDAREYLEKHRILELFDNMTSQLIYNRPDNPKEFLIDQIDKLQKAKATKREYPCLFDDSNIQSVFGMLDPTGKGFITHQQYLEALPTLGIKDFEQRPTGTDSDRISFDTFSREARVGLSKASSTFNIGK